MALPLSVADAEAPDPVLRALAPGAMYPVFQPIFATATGDVLAHEALMRLHGAPVSPLVVLDAARRQGRLGEVETLAARVAAARFDPACAGLVFVNLSSHAILQGELRPQQVLDSLLASGMDLRRFVVELTERDIVEDAARLAEALAYLRARGVRLALDDFGNGHSNFELWHELAPEFVKIDRFLIDGIAASAGRLAIVKALVEVAAALGTELVAEGIEREGDLALVKDMGIGYAQGYLLGRPSTELHRAPSPVLRELGARVPVRPRPARVAGLRQVSAAHLLIDAPALTLHHTNEDAESVFRAHPTLHALPVVDDEGRPVGLVNRRVFSERMARPFARELGGRKPCTTSMHASPILCDINEGITDMAEILRGEDQRYLSDGFVITENGRYRGLGTGEALVRRVTELRIEAARYANPLTLLPGNIPITEHIARLLDAGQAFVVAYCDLNHFKPFNDQYGYFRGDQMIRLVADVHLHHLDPHLDFLGHVGGDDFVAVFQSDDWNARCERIVAEFNAGATQLYDADDAERGMVRGEDRSGRPAMFPLCSLSIGVAQVLPAHFSDPEEIASVAAVAKRRAKRAGVGVFVLSQQEAHALAPAFGA